MDILNIKSGNEWVGIPAIQGPQGAKGDKGDDGQDGFSPTVSVTPISGGQRITITDATGPHTADILNGDPTELIDDTSVADIDKAWSVAKTTEELNKKAPIIIDSKSGNLIVINDGIPGLKLYNVKVSFAPKQTGSGDPSPTNIRPITGLTGLNIYKSGKNLVQFSNQQGPATAFYNGYSGWLTNGSWRIPDMSIKYTYSAYIDNRNASEYSCAKIWFYGADGTTSAGIVEGTRVAAGEEGWSVVSFGNNVNLYFAAFGLGLQAGGIATQGMVEIGESRTVYEQYSGTTIPISWQSEVGEVYGGELDVLTGVLTVEWYKLTLTGEQNYVTNATYIKSDAFDMYIVENEASRDSSEIYCNQLKKSTAYIYTSTGHPNECMKSGRAIHFNIANDLLGITDYTQETTQTATEKMKAYLAELYNNGTPIEFALPLNTPYTVQLDHVTLSTLIGTNTIWTDADGIEIAYPVDTKKYIDAGASDVKDVQMDGTSVLEDGIAKIPMANPGTGTPGVVKVISYESGLFFNRGNRLAVATADESMIKAGTNSARSLVAGRQHFATFYGLSKAAGVDLANETVTVGQYPDAALVAIQKMLGVYEPPYELIQEITLAERTSVEITTDRYGESFQLRTVYMEIWYPANLESETSGYGRYIFYDQNGYGVTAETSKYATNAYASFKQIDVRRVSNRVSVFYTKQINTGSSGSWQIKNMTNMSSIYSKGTNFDIGNIVRIAMNSADYEPAGTKITIYGQRAY